MGLFLHSLYAPRRTTTLSPAAARVSHAIDVLNSMISFYSIHAGRCARGYDLCTPGSNAVHLSTFKTNSSVLRSSPVSPNVLLPELNNCLGVENPMPFSSRRHSGSPMLGDQYETLLR